MRRIKDIILGEIFYSIREGIYTSRFRSLQEAREYQVRMQVQSPILRFRDGGWIDKLYNSCRRIT